MPRGSVTRLALVAGRLPWSGQQQIGCASAGSLRRALPTAGAAACVQPAASPASLLVRGATGSSEAGASSSIKNSMASAVVCGSWRGAHGAQGVGVGCTFGTRVQQATASTSAAAGTGISRRGSASAAASNVKMPTMRQLRILALHGAVPMVGFGIMDQTIMIQAGDLIDSTLGQSLALPTLAAAACGQVFSDFSGVLFGGTVEAFADKMGLPAHGLTGHQMELSCAKKWHTIGAAIGVVIGCLLGMTQMLFMDLKRDEQIHEFNQIRGVLDELVDDDATKLHANRSALYFVDHTNGRVWTVAQSDSGDSVYVEMDWNHGISGHVARTGEPWNVPDAYQCPEFNKEYDMKSKGRRHTESVLCVPVLERKPTDKRVFAVLQFINKMEDGHIVPFTDEDVTTAMEMARTLSFLRPALQNVLDGSRE